MAAVKGRYNVTAVKISAKYSEHFQEKNKRKAMMQVKIWVRKDRYMSTLRAKKYTMT